MNRYASVLFLAILSLITVVGGHGGDDIQTMRALSSLIIPSYDTPWNNTDENPCLWNGVVCSSSTNITSSHVRVTHLFLSGLRLYYYIPNTSSATQFFDLLCKLNSLESLDLSDNSFFFIPTAFFSKCSGLSQLKHLNLSSNYYLAGHLANISSFPSLETLDLSSNKLGGEVGPQLNGLINLKSLNLSHNLFTGTIPLYVGLEELVLSYNSFTGNMPNDILKLKNLMLLDLSATSLSGPVPDGIGELSKLQHLSLSANNLAGEIPGSLASISLLCQLTSLESLDLSSNLLSSIPTAFFSNCSGLSQLKHLSLSSNILAGHLVNFSSFPSLETLDLSHNQLGGEVGPQLNGSINLKSLNLSLNLFTGTIPLYVGLEELVLSYNSFTGNMPNDILKLKNLTLLDLSENGLSGSLPDGIGELYKLEYLDLSSNEFTGEVPWSLTQIRSLVMLELSNNQLSGPLPAFENRVHVFADGNKDLVLNGNHDTPLDIFFILILPFVSGFIVSISLISTVREVILRCYYDDKYEPDVSWRALQPQALVRLENLRRIRQQLDAAHNRYAGAT